MQAALSLPRTGTSKTSADHIPNAPHEAQNPFTPPSHLPLMGTATITLGEEELLLIWGYCAFPKKGHSHPIGCSTQYWEKVKYFLWQQERYVSKQESSAVPAPAHTAALIAVMAMMEPVCNEYPPVR